MQQLWSRSRMLACGLVLSGGVWATAAFAASSTNILTVNATVNGTCKFQSPTSTLAFGPIDPSGLSAATASTTTAYRCTTGTTASVSKDDGLNAFGVGLPRLKVGSQFMPYTLTLTGGAQPGTGHGAGQDKTLTVGGSIAATDFQNAPAGDYVDTVTLTITP